MTKKHSIAVLLFLIVGISLPSAVLADGRYYINSGGTRIPVYYKGFVPCGKEVCSAPFQNGKCSGVFTYTDQLGNTQTIVNCQFCHFIIMINGIINYVLVHIVPYLAVLMIVIGGIMYYLGGGKPALLNKAKTLMTGVVIGLFLIYGAYLIVGTFLGILGVTDITLKNWANNGVFSINCPITIP